MSVKPPDAHWKCDNCDEEGLAFSDEGRSVFPCPKCGKTVFVQPFVKKGPEPPGLEKKY